MGRPRASFDQDSILREELEKLKSEYERLRERRMRAEAELQTLNERLEELKKKAQETYGTSDLNELKVLLDSWRSENEKTVQAYREHIEEIKSGLQKLEEDVTV